MTSSLAHQWRPRRLGAQGDAGRGFDADVARRRGCGGVVVRLRRAVGLSEEEGDDLGGGAARRKESSGGGWEAKDEERWQGYL